jgi:hypothetical protein
MTRGMTAWIRHPRLSKGLWAKKNRATRTCNTFLSIRYSIFQYEIFKRVSYSG